MGLLLCRIIHSRTMELSLGAVVFGCLTSDATNCHLTSRTNGSIKMILQQRREKYQTQYQNKLLLVFLVSLLATLISTYFLTGPTIIFTSYAYEHTSTLSHCHTVTLTYSWHTVIQSYCHIVILSYYWDTEILADWLLLVVQVLLLLLHECSSKGTS